MRQYNRRNEIANARIDLRIEEEGSEIAERIFEIEDYNALVREYMGAYTSSELLDMIGYDTDDKALIEAYRRKADEEEQAYREENEPKLWAFYEEHKHEPKHDENGETWWDFFSDWHKDVYGFRPRYL